MEHVNRVPDRIPPGRIKLTYEDYVELPDDGRRYEILDGELEVSPAPAPLHQQVSASLSFILGTHRCHSGTYDRRAA
jgi:Uma2 family endonuclease